MFKQVSATAIGLAAALAIGPAYAGSGCPSINAIGNFLQSSDYDVTISPQSATVDKYTAITPNKNSTGGVPGIIELCVYPPDPPGLPTSGATAIFPTFTTDFKAIQGFFAFVRVGGNGSNIPADGNTYDIGTADWTNPANLAQVAPPANQQQLLLHINDSAECQATYGGTSDTCFVTPATAPPPPNMVCNGNPACKQIVIDEAITTSPETVPLGILLHAHWTYIIVNQPTNTFDMIFKVPTPATQDINSGGGKDYFGCEWQPDPAGSPGAWGNYANYEGTGATLSFVAGSGAGCPQSRFFWQASPVTIVLHPGQSRSFTIDMLTRVNKGGKQEYTSLGSHVLNSGFTVKWFQNNDTLLHSFATAPISLNVVPPPGT